MPLIKLPMIVNQLIQRNKFERKTEKIIWNMLNISKYICLFPSSQQILSRWIWYQSHYFRQGMFPILNTSPVWWQFNKALPGTLSPWLDRNIQYNSRSNKYTTKTPLVTVALRLLGLSCQSNWQQIKSTLQLLMTWSLWHQGISSYTVDLNSTDKETNCWYADEQIGGSFGASCICPLISITHPAAPLMIYNYPK